MHVQPYRTAEVFVAGKQPTVTYNPRDERHLEQHVKSYLAQLGKALSVSGPTKSGKTVLIERLIAQDRSIWLQGSDLSSADAFWRGVIDGLEAYEQVETSIESGTEDGGGVSGTVGLPGVASVSARAGRSRTRTETRTAGRTRPLADVAREGLRTKPVPIVIDDFHYVPQPVKRSVARAIKTLITMTHVVMVAVPHEAFEAVRQEPDMDARVWQLRIEHWSEDELRYIARQGFEALDIGDAAERVGKELASASYGAPFLMQQLCYDYAISIGVEETARDAVEATQPPSWNEFFNRIANRSVPGVFEKLLRGPNPRGQQRIDRVLNDGRTTDIYGAVLFAIARTGPKPHIRYQEIVRVLERELTPVPGSQQVTSSLSHMARIALESRGSGDAAIDYKDDEVHMLDPFLSFYLRHGSWDVEKRS